MSGALSKATTSNPKDLLGMKKIGLTAVSPIALLYETQAMMEGAWKYGPYNWRDKDVRARIYLDALLRHTLSWFEGEEIDPESGVHHLGHARACLNILLDAQATGKLIDDRPLNTDGAFTRVKAEVNDWVGKRSQYYADKETKAQSVPNVSDSPSYQPHQCG